MGEVAETSHREATEPALHAQDSHREMVEIVDRAETDQYPNRRGTKTVTKEVHDETMRHVLQGMIPVLRTLRKTIGFRGMPARSGSESCPMNPAGNVENLPQNQVSESRKMEMAEDSGDRMLLREIQGAGGNKHAINEKAVRKTAFSVENPDRSRTPEKR